MRASLVATATALVILGASILPFTSPAYVRGEQDRVGVGSLTGYTSAELDTIAGALLGDLFLWRSDFGVTIDGSPVLSDRERGHMRDVRTVFWGLILVVAAAALVLVRAARGTRADASSRVATWRAVGYGARGLAVAVIVLGLVAALAFTAAFEVFHRLFFSSGTYTFDPATDRLVQLFPMQFWSETTMFLGGVMLALVAGVAWFAGRRSNEARRASVPIAAVEAA